MLLDNRKVLVTGAGGFIGSHLVERLLEANCHVRALVRYNSLNHWGHLESLPSHKRAGLEVMAGDVRDAGTVRRAVQGVDVVFHLASLIGIPYSYEAPASYVDVNVHGTMNVLQAALDLGGPRVLVTSTSEVYGTARCIPITEDHPRQAQSPYSATKIATECLAESYYRSFGLPVVIVRPFNTYGPRQSARAVIPTIITQLLAGATELKLGSLHPTRDFNYVKDTVEGFAALAACDEAIGQVVNIASEREVTVGELAQRLVDRIAPSCGIVLDGQRVRPPNSEVDRLLGSSRKLQQITPWQPKYSLEQGIDETIDWFRQPDIMQRYKPDLYTR